MTHSPTGIGVVLIFDESLRVTEVHGEHSTERVTGFGSEVEVEIQSQLSHIFVIRSAKVNPQNDFFLAVILSQVRSLAGRLPSFPGKSGRGVRDEVRYIRHRMSPAAIANGESRAGFPPELLECGTFRR